MEIKEEKGYRIADIQAVSGTILLDQKKSNRVFQKKVQTYMGIASTVTADTEHSACILPGSDMRTGGTLIQYQETDWRFLKRMASQLGLPLVPDTSYYYPRFYLGLSEGEKRESGEIPSCDMCFDGRYYAVSGFITGAIGAKFPGMNHLVEGVVDTTVSAGERLAYAVFDDSMSWDEKWAYAFDPGQMVADFVTGGDWHNYFNENYGADNVTWESASIQDIIDMPSKITDFSPKQISNLASRNGWTVEPLGKGRLAGIPYEQGGGISMHAPNGSSIYIQYHPGSGHHGVMPYYKISSGKNGIVRYYINGESTIMGKDIEELMQCYDRFVDIVKQISMNANEQIVKLKGTIAADELANDFSEIGMMYAKELLENEWITQEQYTIAKTIDEMLVNMSKRKELWSEEALFNAEEWDECRKKGNLLLKMIE